MSGLHHHATPTALDPTRLWGTRHPKRNATWDRLFSSALHPSVRGDVVAMQRGVASHVSSPALRLPSCMKFPHHGLGGQDPVHHAAIARNYHLASCHRVGCMEDRCSLYESIEVVTQFVKQYPHLRGTEGSRGDVNPVAIHTASEDLARVKRIA